jgi:deoxyinosine 3'endonuclease (endonuclease V)
MGKDYIEVDVIVGYDASYREETEHGTICGIELSETIRMSMEEAATIVQNQVHRLDYDAAKELVRKYKK